MKREKIIQGLREKHSRPTSTQLQSTAMNNESFTDEDDRPMKKAGNVAMANMKNPITHFGNT